MMNVIETAALGRPFQLGMLYDCRKDVLITGITLWDPEMLQQSLRDRPQCYTNFRVSASDSIEDKSTLMNINGSLTLSVLGGLVSVTGAAKYLNDTKKSFRQQRLTLHYHSTCRFEELTMSHLAPEKIIHQDVIDNDMATHVVTALLYGTEACFVFDREVSADEEKSTVEAEARLALDKLKYIKADAKMNLNMNDSQMSAVQKFTCTFYGDLQLPSNPTTFEDALKVYADLPKLLGEKKENAVPQKVWLYPLDKLLNRSSKLQKEISMNLIQETQSVFESLNTAEMKCTDLLKDSPALSFPGFYDKILQMKDNCSRYKLRLMQRLGSLLPNIRGNAENETELNNLLQNHEESPFRRSALAEWLKERERESDVIKSVLKQLTDAGAQLENNIDLVLMDLDAVNIICYTFTSLNWTDVLLLQQTSYLSSSGKEKRNENQSDSMQKSWLSPAIQKTLKRNLKIFRKLKNIADCESARFIVSSREMQNNPGSCILLYEEDCDEPEFFAPPSPPGCPVIEEVTENTVVLQVPQADPHTVKQVLLYKLKQDSDWTSKPMLKDQHTITLTDLRSETAYDIKCAAVGKLNYTEYSDVLSFTTQSSRSLRIVSLLQMYERRLKEEFHFLNEENSLAERKLLDEVYTKSQITEEPRPLISNEREIKSRNMFTIRTVLMKGDAGIGKTVTVQKLILDWAEEKSHPDIKYIFPLSFQKLNMINEVVKQCSFMQILQQCFKHIEDFNPDSDNIMLIFDGLNEFKCALDFRNTKKITDINEPASVSALLTNLIMGNLLPYAQIWITSRPAAAQLIPEKYIDRVTTVHGFNDQQKEEYFRKNIRDQRMCDAVIRHIKSSRRINSMCYSPDYCRIIAAIPERIITTRPDDFPKTLTQMYSRLLLALTEGIQNRRETIIALGRLALDLMVEGRTVFTDDDLRKHDIRDKSGLTRSSIIKKIEDRGNDRYFSFVNHRTQEFLAALYVTDVINGGKSLKLNDQSSLILEIRKESFTDYSSLQQVMEVSLVKQMDLFFCFLLGLTLESSQRALRDLLKQRRSSSSFSQNTAELIKIMIMKSLDSADRRCLLFDAQKELDEPDLIQKIKTQLKSADSPAGFELLNSKERLNKPKSQQSEECPVKIQQGGKTCTEHEGDAGACAGPRSNPFYQRELDWSGKHIPDLEVKQLSSQLVDPQCKLEILRLSSCHISEWSLHVLSSALILNPSHLRELDLSGNEIKDSALNLLSGLMADPLCKLEKLRLNTCKITDSGFADLGSALKSNPSHLRELDLSENLLSDSGVKRFLDLLKHQHCNLEILRLRSCHITDSGCTELSSALRLNPSHLRELDLSGNYIGYSRVEKLAALLADPLCKLEKLRLRSCRISDFGCANLISALKSNPSHLKELDLSDNFLGYLEIKKLLNLIADLQCKLQKLGLRSCFITDSNCADLISALRSNPSHLRELDLSGNEITDSEVKQLSALLEDPQCKLEKLRVILEDKRHADQTSHQITYLANHFQKLELKN